MLSQLGLFLSKLVLLSLFITSVIALESDDDYNVKRAITPEGNESNDMLSALATIDLATIRYNEQAETLKNLPGVYLFTDYIYRIKNTVPIDRNLTYQIEERLRSSGIHVYTKDSIIKIIGQPEIQIYLSVTEGNRSCCISMWMALLQGSALIRSPDIKRRMGTWGSGESFNCEDGREGKDIEAMILRHVDKFIADYQKVNKEPKKAKLVIAGSYSNFNFVTDNPDSFKVEIRLVLSEKGNFALVDINDGLVRVPQRVVFELDDDEVYFILPKIRNSNIGGRYTGKINKDGMTLQSLRKGLTLFLPKIHAQ